MPIIIRINEWRIFVVICSCRTKKVVILKIHPQAFLAGKFAKIPSEFFIRACADYLPSRRQQGKSKVSFDLNLSTVLCLQVIQSLVIVCANFIFFMASNADFVSVFIWLVCECLSSVSQVEIEVGNCCLVRLVCGLGANFCSFKDY